MKRAISLFSGLVFALGLGACTVNPVTGERELSFMSAEQEVAIGTENYMPSQQSQGGRYVTDPDLGAYISRVTQRLAEVSDRPGLPYEIVVLNNGVPNAWALPGGKMAINRGLLVELEDEAQLASVLGHEIVHAAARHGATQNTRNMLLQGGMLVAGVAATQVTDSEYTGLAIGALGVGAMAWQARYSRSHELEADYHGMQYMMELGYDPQGAVELQETFMRMSEGRRSNWLEGMFASHPPSQDRVRANRQLAEQNPGGKRNKAEFERAMAQLRRDQPAYEDYEEAQKAASEQEYGRAMTLVQQAIDHQPRENLFWELKGQLHMQEDKPDEAIAAFDRSISANPEFFRPLVYRGVVHKRQGDAQQARRDLEASEQLLPTQLASYHLGELAMDRGDRSEAVSYFQRAAQGGGALGDAAQEKLNQLGS